MDPEVNKDKTYQQRLVQLSKVKGGQSAFLKWDTQSSEWRSCHSIMAPQPSNSQTISTLSFNVLYDRIPRQQQKGSMEHILLSRQRFSYILQTLGEMDTDIIGLQQVTKIFFQMLLECEWARKKYWVSNFLEYQKSFGNMILTKINPICVRTIKVKKLPRIVCSAFFPVIERKTGQIDILCFSSVHLVALDKNHGARAEELHELILELKKYENIVADFVIQGDMNYHAEVQTQSALKYGLKDCWLQKYDHNLKQHPGFTFDSKKNHLINEMYWGFERRQMRLDRIFYLGNILRVKNIEIIFDKMIKGAKDQNSSVSNYFFLKGICLFAADYFKWNIRGDKKYLFASDHFGLIATLQINTKDGEKTSFHL